MLDVQNPTLIHFDFDRVEIDNGTLQRFTVGSKPEIVLPQKEESTQRNFNCEVSVSVPKSRRKIVYNTIGESL